MEYKNIIFDDFVADEIGTWSQICQSCKDKYFDGELTSEIPIEGLICGVKNCNNEADFYLDFDYEKQLDKRRANSCI